MIIVLMLSNDHVKHPELDQDRGPGAAGDGGSGGSRPQAPRGERLGQQDQAVPEVCSSLRRELILRLSDYDLLSICAAKN